MWVVPLSRSVPVLIITKVGLEKCQKFIPINIMSIKNNFIVNLTLEGHNEMEDWKITIIDRAENVLELRRSESYLATQA